jgi:parvulin-like peptidyl-prolyl isomerase
MSKISYTLLFVLTPRRSVSALAAALVLLAICSSPALSRVIDGIAIIVNKDAILVSEINSAMLPILQEYRTKYSGPELEKKVLELRETVINQAIENKLVVQVAKVNGIKADEKMIDSRIEIVKKRFPSEDEFLAALAAKGITFREYREQVAEQVLVQETLKRVLGANIDIQDYEVKEYYDAHLDEFETEPAVKLAQIFLQVPSGTPKEEVDEIREKAEQLYILLEDGADFSELATQYSQGPYSEKGGVIGVFSPEEIRADLKDTAFSLETGEYSSVIETAFGFHILMAIEATPSRKIGLEEAKPLIEERIREERRTEKHSEWIKRLKEDSYIDIKI